MMMDLQTVVLEEQCGAVLRYPPGFSEKLVERPFGTTVLLDHHTSTATKKRKRKRKGKFQRKLNYGEILQKEYHSQVRDRLLGQYSSLLAAAKQCGYFPLSQTSSSALQNSSVELQSLCELDALVPLGNDFEPLMLKGDCGEKLDLFGRLICNCSGRDITISAMGKRFLFPQHSSFLLSDFSKVRLLAQCSAFLGKKYDLIVIDPPWENRSAIRAKRYHWLPKERLLELPVPQIAAPGAVIAVWVTNKRRFAEYVEEVLFPTWGVVTLGEWHWIKVTTAGELVFDMDSVHKKPYEVMILGKVLLTTNHAEHSAVSETSSVEECAGMRHTHKESDTQLFSILSTKNAWKPTEDICTPSPKRLKCSSTMLDIHQDKVSTELGSLLHPTLPSKSVFLCVPSTVHSQKPYIGDLLAKYLPPKRCCLELFARNLLPNWTSWGNEVLKFQEI